MPSYDQVDLMRSYGLTYRQIDWWTRQSYLKADARCPGMGNPRSWAKSEHRVAKIMIALVNCGFKVETAHHIARQILESNSDTVRLGPGVSVTVQ